MTNVLTFATIVMGKKMKKKKKIDPNENQTGPSSVQELAIPYTTLGYTHQSDHALLGLIRNGVSYPEFERIKSRSGLSLVEWAHFLSLSERTLLRYSKSNEHLDKSTSERIIEIAILQEKGQEVFGSLSAFNLWMDSPIRALGNTLPKEYLDSSIGIQILSNLLGRIEHGIPS